jgi:hypothetical protein
MRSFKNRAGHEAAEMRRAEARRARRAKRIKNGHESRAAANPGYLERRLRAFEAGARRLHEQRARRRAGDPVLVPGPPVPTWVLR